ncbi:MAG: AAA family ATPase [Methanobacteriaceae archaeon]
MNNICLKIENFGPIEKATIELGKINIIAGNNATGKSTASKLIYSLLIPSSSDEQYIIESHINRVIRQIRNQYRYNLKQNFKNKDVYSDNEEFKNIYDDFEESIYFNRESEIQIINEKLVLLIEKYKEIWSEVDLDKEILNDLETLQNDLDELNKLLSNPSEIFKRILEFVLKEEFGGSEQLLKNFINSHVNFYQYSHNLKIKIDSSEEKFIKTQFPKDYLEFKVNKVIYVDTPYILDFEKNPRSFATSNFNISHRQLLVNKLKEKGAEDNIFDDIMNKSLIKILDEISNIIDGKIIYKFGNFLYEENSHEFSTQNTATGIKSIGIIKALLENRTLQENSFLIMDEPEVHLHPEWQIKLAKILIIIVKNLDVTLVINSHSPYFIEAIQKYSELYELDDYTKYYLAENTKKSKNIIKNVENLKEIYEHLSKPFEILDKVNETILKNEINK